MSIQPHAGSHDVVGSAVFSDDRPGLRQLLLVGSGILTSASALAVTGWAWVLLAGWVVLCLDLVRDAHRMRARPHVLGSVDVLANGQLHTTMVLHDGTGTRMLDAYWQDP